ncbi:MAG: RluA family pseudouridine synthase [Planctomycetota bacterium]
MDDVPNRLDFSRAEEVRFTAGPQDAGRRLDLFLAERLRSWSRASVQRLIRMGAVRVDGAGPRASTRLHVGAGVEVRVPRVLPYEVVPQDLPLRILMEEPSFAVIDKPPGVPVHPGRGRPDGTLANAIAHRYGPMTLREGHHRPGIVHRLDLDTTGVLLVARTEAAHAFLQAAFKGRRVRKEYRALAFGDPPWERDRIDVPLGRDLVRPDRMAVRFEGGREALTEVEVAERFGSCTLLTCRPHTGRTHQIRLHLCARGHPVLGDELYAGRRRPPVAVPRLMLHALRLTFPHPESQEPVEAEAPLPDDMRRVLAELRAPASD